MSLLSALLLNFSFELVSFFYKHKFAVNLFTLIFVLISSGKGEGNRKKR